MTYRHSEFIHASYLPTDSCDFDFDEIDRRISGEQDPKEIESEKPTLLDEIATLRRITYQIVNSEEPHITAEFILKTLCKDVY